MALVCPTCGNAQVFLVKTAQAHVVRLHASRVDVLEETRPPCPRSSAANATTKWT